jgi:crotonobetaine/carnitine-CoA ligase
VERQPMLPQLIRQRAEDFPDRVYIQHVGAGSLTYSQLHNLAMRWAAAYRQAGVTPGDPVLTMMPLNLDFYCSAIGLAWLLGVEAPVNIEFRGQLLLHAIRSAQPKVIVAQAEYVRRFEEIAAELDSRPLLVIVGGEESIPQTSYPAVTLEMFLQDASPVGDLVGPQPWDVASIMYTSGTTGPSKGVIMPWGQLYEIATRGVLMSAEFTEDDRYYLPSVTYHMSAKGVAFTMACVNGQLVIRDRFSVSSFFADVARYGCTLASMFGASAQLLNSADRKPEDADTTLRHVLMSPLLADIEGFMKRFDLQVTTGYGMTEIGPVLCGPTGQVSNDKHQSCGRLMPGYEVRLVDEHDEEVRAGELGELIVRSDRPWTLNLGYVGQPEESMQAWRNGWFHTGDIFRVDTDGYFYFVDRLKDAIRRRGENISSFEVEAIVNTHPDVVESAAVAVPSDLGEDDVKVVVVRRAGSDLSESNLIDFLTPVMPRFMIPRYVEFIDTLPKTPTDRVQKARLRSAGVTPQTWDRTISAAKSLA